MSVPARPWRFPRWIAHRGAGKLAPENTLAAFRLGAQHGYRAFECDVKLSADGVPFLLHDATLDRTTDATGIASAQPWSALSRLDAGGWHGRAFAGEPLASLVAVAAYCRANRFALNIEIKPTPGDETATGAAVAAQAARLFAERPDQVLLSSFSPVALEAARSAAPDLGRALLVEQGAQDWLDGATALGCVAVVTHFRMMDAALVERLRAERLRACVYTVNEPQDALRLRALGIDGIITDAVDKFAPSEEGG